MVSLAHNELIGFYSTVTLLSMMSGNGMIGNGLTVGFGIRCVTLSTLYHHYAELPRVKLLKCPWVVIRYRYRILCSIENCMFWTHSALDDDFKDVFAHHHNIIIDTEVSVFLFLVMSCFFQGCVWDGRIVIFSLLLYIDPRKSAGL